MKCLLLLVLLQSLHSQMLTKNRALIYDLLTLSRGLWHSTIEHRVRSQQTLDSSVSLTERLFLKQGGLLVPYFLPSLIIYVNQEFFTHKEVQKCQGSYYHVTIVTITKPGPQQAMDQFQKSRKLVKIRKLFWSFLQRHICINSWVLGSQ